MSASVDSVPKTPPSLASLRGLAIPELVVFLTFSVVVLAGSSSWLEAAGFAAPPTAAVLAFAGSIVLLILAAVAILRWRRARQSRAWARKALASIEAQQISTSPVLLAHAARRELEVQELRHTVRTLTTELAEQRSEAAAQARMRVQEQAKAQAQAWAQVQEQAKAQAQLQEQAKAKAQALALAQVQTQTQTQTQVQDSRDVGRERSEMRAAEARRVLLMIRAMREATAGEPGAEHVLNRIEAALTRLNAPSGGRPTLPALLERGKVPDGSPLRDALPPVMSAVSPLPPEPAAYLPVPAAPPAHMPAAPVPPVSPEPAAYLPVPAAPPAVPPAPEPPIHNPRVLPVPPPAPEPAADRDGGRWFRRTSGRHAERSGDQRAPR